MAKCDCCQKRRKTSSVLKLDTVAGDEIIAISLCKGCNNYIIKTLEHAVQGILNMPWGER